jgi:hypothetical protein
MKNFTTIVIAFIFCLSVLFGCKNISEKELNKDKIYSEEKKTETETAVNDANTNLVEHKASADIVITSAGAIRKASEDTIKSTPEVTPQVRKNQFEIIKSADTILKTTPLMVDEANNINNGLKIQIDSLKTWIQEVEDQNLKNQDAFSLEKKEYEKNISALLEKQKELELQIESLHKGLLYKILTICILIAICGIPLAIYVSPKLGIGVGLCGTIGASLCIFLIKYLMPIAIGVGISVIVAGIIALVIHLKNKKALTEVVKSFQFQKDKVWEDEQKAVISLLQSPETKKVVEDIKAKL